MYTRRECGKLWTLFVCLWMIYEENENFFRFSLGSEPQQQQRKMCEREKKSKNWENHHHKIQQHDFAAEIIAAFRGMLMTREKWWFTIAKLKWNYAENWQALLTTKNISKYQFKRVGKFRFLPQPSTHIINCWANFRNRMQFWSHCLDHKNWNSFLWAQRSLFILPSSM